MNKNKELMLKAFELVLKAIPEDKVGNHDYIEGFIFGMVHAIKEIGNKLEGKESELDDIFNLLDTKYDAKEKESMLDKLSKMMKLN